MANVINKGWGGWGESSRGTLGFILDTTVTLDLGQAAIGNVGSYIVQVQGTGFTGSLKPQILAPGGEHTDLQVAYDTVGLVNLNDFTEISGATGITADGSYSFRADHGMRVQLVVTVSAGSAKVLIRKGDG
jgi:hypothetical protein